ncbi:MAG: hypothetical protein ACK4E7_09835 [Permianibacter sp.]
MEGMNLSQAVPFDAQAFLDASMQGATVNEQEGWVQGLNQTAIQTQLQAYQNQVKDYLEQNHSDATVGEVIGTKTIIETNEPILMGSLPYIVKTSALKWAELPTSLRHKFTFKLYNSDGYGELSGGALWTVTESLPKLAGKKLALSFTPATAQDEQTLINYLPSNIQSEADIPKSLPANLIRLKAEFTIDGQAKISQGSHGLGQELLSTKGLYSPQWGWQTTDNPLIAGEYHAIGLDLQGMSPETLNKLEADLMKEKEKINVEGAIAITKHNFLAGELNLGLIGYFDITNTNADLFAQLNSVVRYRAPSYGEFFTSYDVMYFWGVPKKISLTGVMMDIDRVQDLAVARSSDLKVLANFHKKDGEALSAFEHLIPELIFKNSDESTDGVSAVKALALASANNQKIFTITLKNIATALPKTYASSEIKNEIRNAVDSGKSVIIHEKSITLGNWSGFGYQIIDDATGAGAYKISGGTDGGWKAVKGGLQAAKFNVTMFLAAGKLFTKLIIVLEIIKVIDLMLDLIEVIEKCWNKFGLLKALTLISVVAFLMASIAISVANPLLGLLLLWPEDILQNYINDYITGDSC